jgi:hypothetical protein
MPHETSSSKQDKPLKSLNEEVLDPSDYELPSADVTSLEPRRKPAGRPAVKPKKQTSTVRQRVVVPGLGKVTLVTH